MHIYTHIHTYRDEVHFLGKALKRQPALLYDILDYLDTKSVAQMSNVCKLFNEASKGMIERERERETGGVGSVCMCQSVSVSVSVSMIVMILTFPFHVCVCMSIYICLHKCVYMYEYVYVYECYASIKHNILLIALACVTH